MRKLITVILGILTLLLLLPANLHAQEPYVIDNYSSNIEVLQDQTLKVNETIEVSFNTQRHGIFRGIPTLHTANGLNIKTPIRVLNVVDPQGNSYQYEVSNERSDKRIKIGDPNRYVKGEKTYLITYEVRNVLREYESLELYWNVVGGDWDTTISSASATVVSPHAGFTKAKCFSGRVGRSEDDCSMDVGENEASFSSSKPLGPNSDLTIVLAFSDKNDLIAPSIFARTWWLLSANWVYLVSVLPFLVIYYFWHKKGRDKRYASDNVYYKPDNVDVKTVSLFARKNLPMVYHPLDGVSPAEVGTLLDDKVHMNDVVAEILELGRLGFIRIEKVEKDKFIGKKIEYLIVNTGKKSEEADKLKPYQKLILDELFKSEYIKESKRLKKDYDDKKLPEEEFVFLSSLKNSFYKKLKEFKKDLYKRMKDEGFYEGNPEKTRVKWIVVYFIILSVTGYLVFTSLFRILNPYPLILYAISASAGFVFAYSMPSRTPKGYSLYKQALGLQEYLKKGKWRYEHMEKNLFVKDILPLAVSLKVVDQLAEDMEKAGVKPPDYTGTKQTSLFAATYDDFYSQTSSNLSSSPKSSSSSYSGGSGFSGGSSGGGFGGGGGGSW